MDRKNPQRRPRSRRNQPARTGRRPSTWLFPGLGALGVVVVVLGLVIVFSSSPKQTVKKPAKPTPEARAPLPSPEPSTPAKQPVPEKTKPESVDLKHELKTEFRRRFARAQSVADKTRLATWCMENGLEDKGRRIVTRLLAKDPGNKALNRLIGNRLFTGENIEYANRWLSPEEYRTAEREEKAYLEKLLNDPQFEAMHSAVSSIKYQYLKDYKVFSRREWPYVIVHEDMGNKNRNEHYGSEKADQVRAFYGYFTRTYPELAAKKLTHPFCIIIFKDRASFLDFHKKRGEDVSDARAYYNPQSKFVYSYEKEPKGKTVPREYTLSVLFHECTHQYLAFLRPPGRDSNSVWFEEALAEYLGGVRFVKRDEDGRILYKLGAMNNPERKMIQSAIRAKRQLPLAMMFRCRTYEEADVSYQLKFGEMSEGRGKWLLYCQGWSFIYFCMHEPSGKYRKKLLDYTKADIEGSGDYDTLCKCFGIADDKQWNPIEREWLVFTKKLKKK